ncbi:S1/P1 nuclease [Flammula alnicola]|nr:S1/P1 nuclease [Flammula alnicola]
MRLSSAITVAALGCSAYLPGANAWGAAGHEIVATIAQMYLHPNVLPTLCEILDMSSNRCHLAPVAAWADQHRYQMRWSATMHYVGALDDYPSQSCAFPGTRGWAGSEGANVLDAIHNTTSLLQAWVNQETSDAAANEALKFLIHFAGDMHQPLHLTGRDRGGNSVKVRFGRRQTNLHSLWDGYLIAKAVRTVPRNYSRPLPYPQVENSLRGTIYDSYIRRIMWEGLLNPWVGDTSEWLSCAASAPDSESAITAPASGLLGMDGVEITPDGPTVCPHHWAQPMHKLNCDIVWPKELDEPPFNVDLEGVPLLDLDTPEYAGVIEKQMIVEKLLAQGGIRLAGLLNYIFAPDGEQFGPFLVDLKAR